MASTDRAKPALTPSPGSTSSSTSTATPSPRVPRDRPLRPMPISATVPIAAARTTLGSVRATITKPMIPTAARTWIQRPRTPIHRPRMSRKPTTSVRLVPHTASRWVSPVVRKSSATSGSRPPSSPATSAGTSSRASTPRSATAARTECRTAAAASHQTPGSRTTDGDPTGRARAAASSSAGASRAVVSSVVPSAGVGQSSSAMTTTGTETCHAPPRPTTRVVRARTT